MFRMTVAVVAFALAGTAADVTGWDFSDAKGWRTRAFAGVKCRASLCG